jgi:alcohol dehydrogenase, propanol-preferring
MKAWQWSRVGETLDRVTLPEPVPGPDQVLVQVMAAGLCTSDLHIMDGTIPTAAQPPEVIGHEVAGVITALGDDVTEWAVGDRVGVDPTANGVSGPLARVGGGYGEFTVARLNELIRIPDAVPFIQAAPAVDAGGTAHKAVATTGGVREGMRVGIVGLGALGLSGATIAAATGAEVYAADVVEATWEPAKAVGVKETFSSVRDFADLELDVIIDFAGFNTAKDAIEVVKHGGRVVQVGLGLPEISFPTTSLVFREVSLVGSLAGSVADTAALYELMAAGKFSLPVQPIPFDDINDELARMRRGETRGIRLVAEYG